MKLFTVFYPEGNSVPYLRQRNPLENSRTLISDIAYQEHERLYLDSALLMLDHINGRTEYTEAELFVTWQILDRQSGDWEDITEPNFIDTEKEDYRQAFRLREETVENHPNNFQDNVKAWAVECFGASVANNKAERVLRFIEEALELAQALELSQEDAHRLVTYVFNRPKGEPAQEVGGTMVTLAALCAVTDLDMQKSGEEELSRIWFNMPAIREKQIYKQHQKITGY